MSTALAPSFGEVTFEDPELVELRSPSRAEQSVTVTIRRGKWKPPERFTEWLPNDFSVPIEEYCGPDGVRRYVPQCSFEELITVGGLGGLAVIHASPGFNPQVDRSYESMRLILTRMRGRLNRGERGVQEHHTRSFNCSRDLYVRTRGRLTDEDRSVLPNDIGLTAAGQGHVLNVSQFTALGRSAATAAGHTNPTNSLAIAYAFFECAKRNPLDITNEEVPVLVQRALFDMTGYEPPGEEIVEMVEERLLVLLNKHLDDSQSDFDRWFFGGNSTVVRQIAKQKKNGGPLPQQQVRNAMLLLGLRAFEYTGQCVHALMRTIKNSMRDELTEKERRLFEVMHESQPRYANLPLALLAECASEISLAVQAIWAEPDNAEHVRVMHRLLDYYGQMVEKRREADRRSKAASRQATTESSVAANPVQVGIDLCVPGAFSTRKSENENPFAEIVDAIREDRGFVCTNCESWDYRLERNDNDSEVIFVHAVCNCNSMNERLEITYSEFAGTGERLLDWNGG